MTERHKIALKFTPATGAVRVRGDPVQLQQVILNLIINAIDAIFEAEAKVREVTVTTGQSGSFAEIRIGDSGSQERLQSLVHHQAEKDGHGTRHRPNHH